MHHRKKNRHGDNRVSNELNVNVTGFLHQMLSTPGAVRISADQAEQVVLAKQWLAEINTGNMVVMPAAVLPSDPAPADATPEEPED